MNGLDSSALSRFTRISKGDVTMKCKPVVVECTLTSGRKVGLLVPSKLYHAWRKVALDIMALRNIGKMVNIEGRTHEDAAD